MGQNPATQGMGRPIGACCHPTQALLSRCSPLPSRPLPHQALGHAPGEGAALTSSQSPYSRRSTVLLSCGSRGGKQTWVQEYIPSPAMASSQTQPSHGPGQMGWAREALLGRTVCCLLLSWGACHLWKTLSTLAQLKGSQKKTQSCGAQALERGAGGPSCPSTSPSPQGRGPLSWRSLPAPGLADVSPQGLGLSVPGISFT